MNNQVRTVMKKAIFQGRTFLNKESKSCILTLLYFTVHTVAEHGSRQDLLIEFLTVYNPSRNCRQIEMVSVQVNVIVLCHDPTQCAIIDLLYQSFSSYIYMDSRTSLFKYLLVSGERVDSYLENGPRVM